MDFAIAECADRRFADMCAELGAEPAVALQAAADSQPLLLRVEAGPLAVVGADMAVVHGTWTDRAGRPWLEAELRVVGVNRGAEPMTELLLVGRGATSGTARAELLAYGHMLLAALAAPGAAPAGRADRSRHMVA